MAVIEENNKNVIFSSCYFSQGVCVNILIYLILSHFAYLNTKERVSHWNDYIEIKCIIQLRLNWSKLWYTFFLIWRKEKWYNKTLIKSLFTFNMLHHYLYYIFNTILYHQQHLCSSFEKSIMFIIFQPFLGKAYIEIIFIPKILPVFIKMQILGTF